MPIADVVSECPVTDSFRVQQVAGLFGLNVADRARVEFRVDVPGEDEPWEIGLIVGPSGSGKSTLARHVFAENLIQEYNWAPDKAVVDCFGEVSIKEITSALTAVGFSSPPSWIKPYRVLSTGEQFRCNLARALCEEKPVVVFDEFTSVIDRHVAKLCSMCVSKTIRRSQRRFVAVTCHYDVAEWLEPDWVVDMATGETRRGRLRRPELTLEVFRARRGAWRMFARHHYLNTENVPQFSRCYLATLDDRPCGFVAVVAMPTKRQPRGWWRVSRIVVLPDYQGIGIGSRLLNAVAGLETAQGRTLSISTTHPAMIAFLKRSPDWRVSRVYRYGGNKHAVWDRKAGRKRAGGDSTGRILVSAVYRGGQIDLEQAQPTEHRKLVDRAGVG